MGQLKQRIGNFLILIGVFLLILYFASNANETPNFLLLLGSVGSLFLGYQFAKRPRIEPSESKRFRTVRRIMGQRIYEDDPEDEFPNKRN
jgi:steroid 5-alpha reductase family enzyme